MTPVRFANALLAWYDQHGRQDLPWRQQISAYRVWVSEIMLQQTQVQTVIPYFLRFMQQFPQIKLLAQAAEDEVLHLWTGLGYYARARHLLRTARYLQEHYQGEFPASLKELENLPGIGRSTAGAILAIAMKQRAAILDGNVKRVLARLHAIPSWPGLPKTAQQLWSLAEHYTPKKRVDDYTQAIMDLGATVCTRSQPQCHLCPVKSNCQAHTSNQTANFPVTKPKITLPQKHIQWLILRNQNNEILLEKRPSLGIWGGLWSFLECPADADAQAYCQRFYHCSIEDVKMGEMIRHHFSHFQLNITPVYISIKQWPQQIMDSSDKLWYKFNLPTKCGLPSPVKRLLAELQP